MKAVAYCRYSTNNQREESIEAQLRAIQDYCNKENITLIDTYIDSGKSATNDNRPNFISMIQDSAKQSFDIVLVHKLDRFARNRYDSAFYRKKLKDGNVKLVSVLEQFDDSPESIILESVLEGMSEYYSKNLAREVLKGMRENAMKGVHNGGVTLLGYDVSNGQYVINEGEAAIVRKAYDLYLKNYGYYSISNILNKEGYKTKKGNPFQTTTVKAMLENIKYTGVYKFEDIEIKDHAPAIIDAKIFNEVRLKAMSKKPKPRNVDNVKYLLTGLLECGVCDATFIGGGYNNRHGKKLHKYICASRQKNSTTCGNAMLYKKDFEEAVLNLIQEEFLTDAAIESIANDIAFKIENKRYNGDVDRLIKEKKELEVKLNKLFDLYLDDKIDKNMIGSKSDEFRKSIDHLEHEIRKHDIGNDSVTKDSIREYLILSRHKLNDESPELQRQVIESFIEKIVINQSEIKIYAKVSDNVRDGVPLYRVTLTLERDHTKIKSPV